MPSNEQIWQVKLPDGSIWVPEDAHPDDPRRSWIYSRFAADMFAREVGGKVVEVSRHQKERLLDQEIATTLTPRQRSSHATRKTKPPR